MATIASLAVSLTANTTQFSNRLQKASKQLTSMRSVIGGVIGGAGLGALIQKNLDAADRIQKLAIQTGATTEFLSEMRGVAQLAGVEFEKFAGSIPKMQRAIAEANDGTAEYADAFDKLGINVSEFVNLSPDEQFRTLADRISGISNPAERANIAMSIFGRTGADLLPVLDGGAEGLDKMRQEAHNMGLTLSRDAVDGAAAANDSMTTLKNSIGALGTDFALKMAPFITQVANGLRQVIPPAVDVATRAFQGLGSVIGGTFAILAQLVQGNFRNAFNIGVDVAGDLRELISRPLDSGSTQGSGLEASAKKTAEQAGEQTQLQRQMVRALERPRLAVAG